jgi:hypothetical protein
MKTNNKLKELFENQEDWDFEIPNEGHEKRFIDKLRKQKSKKKRNKWLPLSIAASLLLGFGFFYMNYAPKEIQEVTFSPQVQETHDYFSSIIRSELDQLKKKQSKQNEEIINDALIQMEVLEKDYQKLKEEIGKNGENKQILYAMITNMQTRISFIKSVLEQVEDINKINNIEDEKHI